MVAENNFGTYANNKFVEHVKAKIYFEKLLK